MLERWLSFGLSAEQEDRFRQTSLGRDVAQARITIALVLVVLLAFAINDYRFFGLSWRFYTLGALRLALVAHAAFLLGRLRRFDTYRAYDREEFVFGLTFAAFVVVTSSTRPEAFVAHVIVAVVAVFLTVLALPNRFGRQLALSAIYVIGETLVLSGGLWTAHPISLTVVLSLWLASGVAVAIAWQVHGSRRREFLAREGEQAARAETERLLAANEALVAELRASLENVKTLSGLVPICMHCKSIRNDKGYWEQIERYVSSRTSAQFTHGLCPDCMEKHYR